MSEPAISPDDSGIDFKTSSPSPLAFVVSFDHQLKPKPSIVLGPLRKTMNPRRNNKGSRVLDNEKDENEEDEEDENENGSEAGTYTIDKDDENEEEKNEYSLRSSLRVSHDDKRDWIAHWAQTSTRSLGNNELGTMINSSEDNSKCRRKLPALPKNERHETEDLLKDTLKAMNSLEARIHVVQNKSVKRNTLSSSSSSPPTLTSVSRKLVHKAEELEAWKRRKNYKPSPLISKPSISSKIDGTAKKKLGIGQKKSLGNGKTSNTFRSTSASPSSVVTPRSTSSMSSKDAEFQAWKRRKNYNPLHAVALANESRKKQNESRNSLVSNEVKVLHSLESVKLSNGASASSTSSGMPPRSASFHYPDGLSRLQHNVYTSEDEDDESFQNEAQFSSSQPKYLSDIDTSPRIGNKSQSKWEALDNLVISTIYSVSSKLCLASQSLLDKARCHSSDLEVSSIIDTLIYVLDDIDAPMSHSKKTSQELSGTLRNLKKVEQVLQILERMFSESKN